MVVGEVSGDTLGAALIRNFKAKGIDAEFEGIGGPQMIAEGFHSLYSMETLSVMGLVEVLKHLKELFAVRDSLIQRWTQNPVDLFIGIDAPDFNLRVSKKIKDKNLPIHTVQYVSPSVWAWRQKRVYAIKYAVDLVLCLFPFEVEFYQKYQVAAVFVGHPLAQQLSLTPNSQQDAKQQLVLEPQQQYLALLPGSRHGEVARLLPVMLEAVVEILPQHPKLKFLIPAINQKRAEQIQEILAQQPTTIQQHILMIENQSKESNIGRLVMQASDAIVLASGTATLEALLLHRPMLVIYKLNWLTYQIAKHMVKIPYVSLPNILSKKMLVKELIQNRVTAQTIAHEVNLLLDPEQGQQQQQQLIQLHQLLTVDQSIQDPAIAILQHFQIQ
ncbi:lipid-A-disaccharide synthase [Acinetobacter qingfengensis]|uniref:Lipid-A-disaccharide synthase n=1 Tax=Acinetobacter qingfengensis TaxID=1262585 RepID=A0A1E7QZ52_9GAMM|nr:lipid-A-disaccharide synthase [Acinetobacter qingfengensis]KAA8731501.1 lipid-A-disaccharide synthase [Acinetobacter qingfengensis]OEY92313.1 lipid-A-disaccharide synthase [Acinetobacter qingfengensis]